MNINGKTQLIGLLGWPVSHTFSPKMHNAAAAAVGLNWVYLPLPVHPDGVETAVRGLPALGFRGVNVTVPHKQAVMPFLDEIEAGARAIGAVNTIKIEQDDGGNPYLSGFNTDWSGFLADLAAHDVDVVGRDCVVLGAGGAARAVTYALSQQGCRIHLLARRMEQVRQLVADIAPFAPNVSLSAHLLEGLDEVITAVSTPLIINTTPLGMTPNAETTVWPDTVPFPHGSVVYDLVYNPTTTQLMRQAMQAGRQAFNGLGMLVWQGAKAFEIWTGVEPDVAVMREAIE